MNKKTNKKPIDLTEIPLRLWKIDGLDEKTEFINIILKRLQERGLIKRGYNNY